MSGVPYTFASATSSIPLSELDSNFATPVTIGTTSVTLGNTVTTLANVSLSNVTISSVASVIPNNFVANSSVIVNGTSNVAIASANGAVTMVTNGNTAVTIDTAQKVTLVNDATIHGLTVGQGGGSVSTNTAVGGGSAALGQNSTGTYNAGFGYNAGYTNSTGSYNSYFGAQAGNGNVGSQSYSTGLGAYALSGISTGANNIAVGAYALQANTTASNNTAVGYQAGYSHVSNGYSVYIGNNAGYLSTGQLNTFVGPASGNAFTTGIKNTVIGGFTGNQGGLDIRTASNYIVLSDGDGNPRGIFDGSGRFIVGATSTNDGIGSYGNFGATGTGYAYGNRSTSASGANAYFHQFVVAAGGSPSQVGSISYNGTLTVYATTSDQRLKENIIDAPSAINYINSVKIRSFDWIDTKKTVTYGVVAQELNTVAPEGVIQGIGKDDMWSVDTSVLVPAMVKAIQEQQALITAQAADIAALKAKVGL